MLINDHEGALQSYAWFEAQFPDDVGEPMQYLCWTLSLYRAGDLEAATSKLRQTMLSNLYITIWMKSRSLNYWRDMDNVFMKSVYYTIALRTLAVATVVWAIIATVRIMTSPAAMTAMSTTSGEGGTITTIGWFEYAGFYGTVLLLLWMGLFVWGAWAAWTGRTAVLAFIAIGTLVFSWLTLLSLGGWYLPTAIILVAALIVSGLQKRRMA